MKPFQGGVSRNFRLNVAKGFAMGTIYDKDVLLWSREQARLLRDGQFSRLDIEHLADEIEDVGKSEQRELANRMAVLLAHLLKWRLQADRRSRSWQATITYQRKRFALALKKTPSLKAILVDPDWREEMWLDALAQTSKETGLDEGSFDETWLWSQEQVLSLDFWPG